MDIIIMPGDGNCGGDADELNRFNPTKKPRCVKSKVCMGNVECRG